MPRSPSNTKRPRLSTLLTGASIVTAVCTFAPAPADAHFILQSPASWASQDFLGNPQKLGPCGDDGATPTGDVTAFAPGETIEIVVDETIFHPGHYRVALSVNDRSELPPPPPVTPASTPCGSTEIQDPAVFPVLLDGALAHSAPFSGPQTMKVTLPADVTCTKCTLQVIEFLSEHALNDPGGCFYHHCADISIGGATSTSTGGNGASTSGAGGTSGASGTSSAGGGSSDESASSSGCSVAMPGGNAAGAATSACLLFLATVLCRRSRRRA